jgi:hypothetical protein
MQLFTPCVTFPTEELYLLSYMSLSQSNMVYSDMREYADALVEVPPGQTTAVVTTPNLAPRRPPDWLQLWQTLVVFTPPAVMIGLVGQIGPFGPAAAATWLALNWWLQ